jgi:hypothetical protein
MTRLLSLLWLLSVVLLSSTALAQTQPPPPNPNAPPAYPSQPAYAPPPAGAPPPGYPPQPSYPAPPAGYSAQPGYAPPPANYPPTYAVMRPPGTQTHDGFYLRLQLGGGYTSMSASSGPNSLKYSGGSVGFGLALGGAVAPNLIIYGALIDSIAQNPDTTFNGPSFGSTSGSVGVVGVGPGLAYYLQPANVFFAGSFLLSRLVFSDTDGNTTDQTDWGFTFEGLVGKEWWVSDNWGLGASAQLLLGTMKDKEPLVPGESIPTWRVVAFSLLFSATFN